MMETIIWKKIEEEIENNSKSKSFSIKHMVIKIIGTKYKKKKTIWRVVYKIRRALHGIQRKKLENNK